MDQTLLNDIISTSVGGAAGGAVAGLVILGVQWIHGAIQDRCHSNRVFKWLSENSDEETPFRSTRAIASYNNLTEDRVRYICSHDDRIKLSTGPKEDMWSVLYRSVKGSTFTGVTKEL